MAEPRRIFPKSVFIIIAALALAGAGLWALQAPPGGPEPIAWDREPCAHCRMHVGEPRFAAQLQTEDGRVLDFDDPGCLFGYLDEHRPAARALYFRDSTGDGWLDRAQVAFVRAEHTPMGYGLAAVPAGTPGALGFDEALAEISRARLARGGR